MFLFESARVIGVFGITSSLAYDVLTNHNNAGRTGRVSGETQLTPGNVSGLKILFQMAQDAIVWGIEYDKYNARLHAYDATTLTELYNSGGLLADGAKLAVPTIFNGRVYLGTPNLLVAFGL